MENPRFVRRTASAHTNIDRRWNDANSLDDANILINPIFCKLMISLSVYFWEYSGIVIKVIKFYFEFERKLIGLSCWTKQETLLLISALDYFCKNLIEWTWEKTSILTSDTIQIKMIYKLFFLFVFAIPSCRRNAANQPAMAYIWVWDQTWHSRSHFCQCDTNIAHYP